MVSTLTRIRPRAGETERSSLGQDRLLGLNQKIEIWFQNGAKNLEKGRFRRFEREQKMADL